ncbi:hypothetical protein GIB67_014342 [Kingdonia uniflora]|uniref:Cupin type-1 domain-containing protein n=1 Tax=Kingdonia uniflora TaxID=39325 RepID=A0A7J7NTV4_9MAGN|nr:hypothetical protein GIB67_014342 [Kingdonia uniflora]
MAHHLLLISLLAFTCFSISAAFEPSPLQDFCADITNAALVNGRVCKDPKLSRASNFFFTGLHLPGNTSNSFGSKVTPVNVAQLPGLNTLWHLHGSFRLCTMGVNAPRTYPRASEILDDDFDDHVDLFQEGGNGLRAHIAVISSRSDHFDVFALETDGDDHKDYESDNCEESSLGKLYSQLVSQLEKLKNEKQSLSGQLKTCEQNRLIAVKKVKLGEIEIEKLRLELTSTQQKLEVFYHGAKNIDKILSMSKHRSDKRGLGFDEQNVKSTSSQVTKFVKATSTSFLPKPSIIDAPHR